MRTDELEFDLPAALIATSPAEPRDSARLLVVSRSDGAVLEHRRVRDLPELLRAGDRLVFNTTRVVPARFVGRNAETGGAIQGLWLRNGGDAGTWVVLLKARRHRAGAKLMLERPDGSPGASLTLLGPASDEDGAWLVRVEGGESAVALESLGRAPLPPYILSARRQHGDDADQDADRERYQTVYADEPGSVAAPTAGLHFTERLLGDLGAAGVRRSDVVLHVGRGTFAPVEAEHVEAHPMHSEWCRVSDAAWAAIRASRLSGERVVAVGTTSCRTIESYAQAFERTGEPPPAMETDLLITPGYRWRATDGLLTNFHLPRSTLLAMVGALFEGGVPRLLSVYKEAIAEGYRFYSYGDAMLILP
ncbi:MAG: tRNA preQ1(34) S-adenosylmethionine ribosyltransferase-isomerase QueA [Planctomycetota bacterium]